MLNSAIKAALDVLEQELSQTKCSKDLMASVKPFKILLESTTSDIQFMKTLKPVLGDPMISLYKEAPAPALRFGATVYSTLQHQHLKNASGTDKRDQARRTLFEDLQMSLIIGVLDFLEGNRTSQNQAIVAAAFYPILCDLYFPNVVERKPQASAKLLSTVYMLFTETLAVHAQNQHQLRDPSVLGGKRLGMAIARNKGRTFVIRHPVVLNYVVDFLALEGLLNLFVFLLPSTQSSPSGKVKRIKFIKEVFDCDSTRLFTCGSQIVQLLEDKTSSQWEVTSMNIVDVLAKADKAYPQPFDIPQINACGATFPQPNAIDRLYLDTQSFLANVDQGEAYETFQALYSQVSSVDLSPTGTKRTKVFVRLTSPPIIGAESMAVPGGGGPLLLEFEISNIDVQRFMASLQYRGLKARHVASTKLSLAEVGRLEFDDNGDQVPMPSAPNQSWEMKDVFEEDKCDSIFSSDFPDCQATHTCDPVAAAPSTPDRRASENKSPDQMTKEPMPNYEDIFGTSDDHASDLSEPDTDLDRPGKTRQSTPMTKRNNTTRATAPSKRKKNRRIVTSEDESPPEKTGWPRKDLTSVDRLSPVKDSEDDKTLVHVSKTFRKPARNSKIGHDDASEYSVGLQDSSASRSGFTVPDSSRVLRSHGVRRPGQLNKAIHPVSPTLLFLSESAQVPIPQPSQKRERPKRTDSADTGNSVTNHRPAKRLRSRAQSGIKSSNPDIFAEPPGRGIPIGKRYARKGRTSSPVRATPEVVVDEPQQDASSRPAGVSTRGRAFAMKDKNGKAIKKDSRAKARRTLGPAKPDESDVVTVASRKPVISTSGDNFSPLAKQTDSGAANPSLAPVTDTEIVPSMPKQKRPPKKPETAPWEEADFVKQVKDGAFCSDDLLNENDILSNMAPDNVSLPSVPVDIVADDCLGNYEEYFVKLKSGTSTAGGSPGPASPFPLEKKPVTTIDLTEDSPAKPFSMPKPTTSTDKNELSKKLVPIVLQTNDTPDKRGHLVEPVAVSPPPSPRFKAENVEASAHPAPDPLLTRFNGYSGLPFSKPATDIRSTTTRLIPHSGVRFPFLQTDGPPTRIAKPDLAKPWIEQDNFKAPRELPKSAANRNANVNDIVSVLNEIQTVMVDKISRKFDGVRKEVREGRDMILKGAAANLDEMRIQSVHHFNSLVGIEEEYSAYRRRIIEGFEDMRSVNQELSQQLRKIVQDHDRYTLSKKFPPSLFSKTRK